MAIDIKSQKLIKECAEKRTPVFFAAEGLDVVFQTYVLSLENKLITLANKVSPAYISRVRQASRFTLQCQMMRFIAESISTDGVNIVFPLDSLKVIEETRQAQRFPFDSSEKVLLEVVNPFDKETILCKSVMDMSSAGLSIRTPFLSKAFAPGTVYKDMKVTIDGAPYARADGTVVYIRKFLGLNGKSYCQVGFRFDT